MLLIKRWPRQIDKALRVLTRKITQENYHKLWKGQAVLHAAGRAAGAGCQGNGQASGHASASSYTQGSSPSVRRGAGGPQMVVLVLDKAQRLDCMLWGLQGLLKRPLEWRSKA